MHEDEDSGRKYYLIKVQNPVKAEERSKDYFKGIFDENGNGQIGNGARDYSDSETKIKPVYLFLNIYNTNKTIFLGKISIIEPRSGKRMQDICKHYDSLLFREKEFSRAMNRLNVFQKDNGDRASVASTFQEEHHSRGGESFEYEDPLELDRRQESDYRRWMLVRHNEIRCRGTRSIRCKNSLRINDEVKKTT